MGLVAIISLTFLILFGSFSGTNSTEPPNSRCPSFDCGNGITISYPFWHQTQESDRFCGYPGFNISCIDQSPIIHLTNKNNPYSIKHINYSNKSLTLSYTLPKNSTCPKLLNISTLKYSATENSLFNYSGFGNKMLNFYYNCSLYPPSAVQLRCLTYGSKRSFVFKEGSVPEFDWRSYCESSVVVPVVDHEAAGIGDLKVDYGGVLRDGFKLRWMNSDRVCKWCEDSGGFCAYSNGRSSCICSSGSRLSSCNHTNSDTASRNINKGHVSIEGELHYAIAGAVLFAGLAIMAIAFYFVQKKRSIGSYKPV